jgi:hypothetical protein
MSKKRPAPVSPQIAAHRRSLDKRAPDLSKTEMIAKIATAYGHMVRGVTQYSNCYAVEITHDKVYVALIRLPSDAPDHKIHEAFDGLTFVRVGRALKDTAKPSKAAMDKLKSLL